MLGGRNFTKLRGVTGVRRRVNATRKEASIAAKKYSVHDDWSVIHAARDKWIMVIDKL